MQIPVYIRIMMQRLKKPFEYLCAVILLILIIGGGFSLFWFGLTTAHRAYRDRNPIPESAGSLDGSYYPWEKRH